MVKKKRDYMLTGKSKTKDYDARWVRAKRDRGRLLELKEVVGGLQLEWKEHMKKINSILKNIK